MGYVTVSKTKHLDKAVKRTHNFLFTKDMHFVPVCDFELTRMVTTMPLVFGKIDGELKLLCLLGLEKGRNIFLNDDGTWATQFVPAVLRAYPFATAMLEDGKSVVVFREDAEQIVDRKDGLPFFNDDGSESEALKDYIQLLHSIRQSSVHIQQACSLLDDLDLFKPLEVKSSKADGTPIKIQGFLTIKQNALDDLKEDKFLELRKLRVLPLVYAHWYSLDCIRYLFFGMKIKDRYDSGLKNLGSAIFRENEEELNFDSI
jgi:hypothetical protein